MTDEFLPEGRAKQAWPVPTPTGVATLEAPATPTGLQRPKSKRLGPRAREALLRPLAGQGEPGGPLAQVGVGELLAGRGLGRGARHGVVPGLVDVLLEGELDVVD